MLYVTGDTHGMHDRFQHLDSEIETTLTENDKLFVCGDWGYILNDCYQERAFLQFLAEKPYQILWVDGNHENFDLLNKYPVENWCGGKVQVIRRDKNGKPKIIHLMRGQVFEIEEKKIFTFGGAYSIDKYMRIPHRSWWEQEMPTDDEKKEAIENLKENNFNVDYIITHAAPEETMSIFHSNHLHEKELNEFLEWIRQNVKYRHWWFGHLHMDKELWRNQTVVWFDLRNMENNNKCVKEEKIDE